MDGTPTLAADTIPITVCDQSKWVHYPAGEQDIRAVLRLLPAGELNGISKVILCLGKDEQPEEEIWEPDPLVGRIGSDTLPGVYSGARLGVYMQDTATIQIFAYVYDADALPGKGLRELYLRLQMLSTLVHEVAHHKGKLARGPRGRWKHDPGNASERSARKQEYRWIYDVVAPYLYQTYPDEVRAFKEWMARYGGVSLPLSDFASDAIRGDFTLSSAVEALAAAVDAGGPLRTTRLGFAHDLRLAHEYAAALQSIGAMLAEDPADVEALALQATTYERCGAYQEAERAAHAALALEATCEDAWKVLSQVYQSRGDWRGVETATSKLIELSKRHPMQERVDRIRARLELGDVAGAEADMQALAQLPYKHIPRRLAVLSALMLLRQGRYTEALLAAIACLEKRKRFWGEQEMLAARFEAAHRLGKPYKAGRLTPKDIEVLRQRGYGVWMDRLIADYGAGKKSS
jgi:tetratricopeptide (TPR) repeat protein